MADKTEQYLGTGRRKCAVARAYLRPGKGRFIINEQDWLKFFTGRTNLEVYMKAPLKETASLNKFDIIITVDGGGVIGQAGAIRHAIARALLKVSAANRPGLKRAGFLTRDPRVKERRKYGLKKARKASQYSKR